jgi:hypothetical protein
LDASVKAAAATKTHLPDNYWQREHAAWLKYRAAMAVVEALDDSA